MTRVIRKIIIFNISIDLNQFYFTYKFIKVILELEPSIFQMARNEAGNRGRHLI